MFSKGLVKTKTSQTFIRYLISKMISTNQPRFPLHTSFCAKYSYASLWTLHTLLRLYMHLPTHIMNSSIAKYWEASGAWITRVISALKRSNKPHEAITWELEETLYATKEKNDERVTVLCNVVDDAIHSVTSCCFNEAQRHFLYRQHVTTAAEFTLLSDQDEFVFFMQNRNQKVITCKLSFITRKWW